MLARSLIALAPLLVASTSLAQTPPEAPRAPAPSPVACAPQTEPRSFGMMVGGIVMSASGGLMLHAASLYPALHPESGCLGSGCPSNRPIVGGLLLGGLVAVAVGVPMIVLGARHVPVRAAWVGAPGGAGWAWTF